MADTNLLVLAREFAKLRENVNEVLKMPIGPQGQDGASGVDGRAGADGVNGKDGKDGPAGRDGLPGRDGQSGKDGVDGQDGRDGVSIVDAYISADNSLVLRLSNGGEIDVGSLDLFSGPGGNSFSVLKQTQDTAELVKIFVQKTFDTVNKNLDSSGGTLAYNVGGDLTSITYANGVVKTLAYSVGGDLISVTLSGATPAGISLVKTFTYDVGGNLTTFAYS
jgi:hypothetical protein